MIKAFLIVVAILLGILGLVSLLSPIPGAALFLSASITILICTSERVQFGIKVCRSKANWLNKGFTWLEEKIGSRVHFIGDALQRTRPDIPVDADN